MNSEQRFVAALLSANKAEQDRMWANHPPLSTFRLHQNEVAWVFSHRENHGKFPSRGLFRDRFGIALPKSGEVLTEALQPILVNAAYADIRRIVDSVGSAFEEKKEPSEIVEMFRNEANKIASFNTSFADENLNDPLRAFDRYKLDRDTAPADKLIIDTPWEPLNKIIGGNIRAGEVFVIAARPYLGKSWIACKIAEHNASIRKVKTLFISKEMPMEQVSDRLTSIRFALPYLKLRNRELSILDQIRWKLGVMRRKKFPLTVSGEETVKGTTLADVATKIQKERPDLAIIDGAYLLSVDGIPATKEREKLVAISQGAKRIAKANNVAIGLVLQMNREADHLDFKTGVAQSKGGLSTIFGSDSWAQDSDLALELRGAAGSKDREIAVLKARDAGIGSVLINFDLDGPPDFNSKVKTADELKLKLKPL